jgi:hypothetical protein
MKKIILPAVHTSWRDGRRANVIVLAAFALAFAAWALMPVMPQIQSYHQFADQRSWCGVPNAADVLSNLAFAFVGIFGVARLVSRRRVRFVPATEAGLWAIAIGIIATAFGSMWYHYNPTDATLVWDRLPMTIIFAGVLGAAAAQRLGNDIGQSVLAALLPIGVASVVYWNLTGDLSLYLAVQFGGIATLVLLLALTRSRDDPIPWLWLVACYVVAKVVEVEDRAIWDATGGAFAGHAVKHLIAAVACAAALWPLRSRR